MKGRRTPAETDTTSELQVGNGLPGAPVIASMSGSQRLQPGWNRGIRFLYPTPDFQGVGIFYTLPHYKGGKTYGKRKPVHL